jgi:predicted alpha/beta-fold hydrolase
LPVLTPTFNPPTILRPAWIQTVAPALIRATRAAETHDELLSLACGDVLQLSWHQTIPGTGTAVKEALGLVVLIHGLEGSTKSRYITGLAQTLSSAGYLVLTWNMRGCGKAPNYLPQWYHSGQSQDLARVIEHAQLRYPDLDVFAVGFSVGGNILCKYLGESGAANNNPLKAAAAISAPLDLHGSAETLAKPSRRVYMEYLLRPLRARIRDKAQRFPKMFDTQGLDSITSFHEFDARYTAPIHGFKSVEHYYDTCSGINYLRANKTPLLIISARDDPFLSESCIPEDIALDSEILYLEAPKHGGHVGFIDTFSMRRTWAEERIVRFFATTQHKAASTRSTWDLFWVD